MFEVVASSVTGVLALTITLMILTFPAWVAGLIVAAQTRVLPVPFFYRARPVRWISWYFTGILSLAAMALAIRPVGTFDASARVVFVCVAVVAYVLTAITAFYISWTASAKRRARRARTDASDPIPLVQNSLSGQPQRLPGVAEGPIGYVPATPRQSSDELYVDEYPAAVPRTQD